MTMETDKTCAFNPLVIGDKVAQVPIIQGGMGVGVSLGSLAGAVAAEGGVGIISTAQIGFYRDDFDKNPSESNLKAIREQIQKAKEIAKGKGLVGVNVMVALKDFALHVKEAASAGADVIISGAGLPMDLPELVDGFNVKIAPIVSSFRAARIIMTKWKRKYNRQPDFVVIEGPKAGGHLGFSADELSPLGFVDAMNPTSSKSSDADENSAKNSCVEGNSDSSKNYCVDRDSCTSKYECTNFVDPYDEEIKKIIAYVNEEAASTGKVIPVVVAGGIFSKEDIEHALELGASGVQMASRFVCTEECDASQAYKESYLNASAEDLVIIKSPVGMPGRAIRNHFTEVTKNGKYPVKRCRGCLARCNPAEIPYCITDALIRAVTGDVENGLLFCGANAGRIDKIVSVHELIQELAYC